MLGPRLFLLGFALLHLATASLAQDDFMKMLARNGDGMKFITEFGAKALEPMVKTAIGQLKLSDSGSPAKSIIDMFMPPKPTTTTTTTTTTLSPIDDLRNTLANLQGRLRQPKLLLSPAKVLDTMLHTSLNVSRAGADGVDHATDRLVKVTQKTGEAVVKAGQVTTKVLGAGLGLMAGPKDPDMYFEQQPFDSSDRFRKPKYFSKHCNFRVACEVGRLLQPMSPKLPMSLVESRVADDLHNRYSRAITYGLLYGDCEKYYCLFVRLLGGPVQFTRGIADLVNSLVNPDLYDS